MDINVTQQGVSIEELLFDNQIEQALDTEFTLPDYCPDISRVLKCRVCPRLSGKTLNGNSVSLDGIMLVMLIYADASDEIRMYEHPVAFTRSIDLGVIAGNVADGTPMVSVRAVPDYVNCRPVTERKLDIHGAVTLFVKASQKQTSEVVADIDGESIEMRRGSCGVTKPLSCTEKYLLINDEIDIPEGLEPVRYNLRTDVMAVATECKIISNKAVIKGDLCLSVLYCGDDEGTPVKFNTTMPLSQIVDIEGIVEGCNCAVDIDVVSFEIKPRTGMGGEARSFVFSVKLCMRVKATCDGETAVLFDAFSTKYAEKMEKKDITFEKLVLPVRERFDCKKMLEFSADDIGSVIDCWCDASINHVASNEAELAVSGTALICVLARDMQGLPVYYERPVDFDYNRPIDSTPADMRSEAIIRATGAEGKLVAAGRLEVTVELMLQIDVYSREHLSVVTAFDVDSDSKKEKNGSALVVYYAGKGERIWDIAKRYNTSVDAVNELNSLNDDVLGDDRMLMIPSI